MKKIIFIILAFSLTFSVFAQDWVRVEIPRIEIPTTATNGMGGHHVAYTDNLYSTLVNPAAMARTRAANFFTLSARISSPQTTFGLIGSALEIMNAGENGIEDLDIGKILEPLRGNGGKIGLGIGINELPLLSFGSVNNGFGWALLSNASVDFNLSGINASAFAYADAVLPLGYGFKIINSGSIALDIGVTLKPFARVGTKIEDFSLLKLLDEQNGIQTLVEDLSIPVIVGGSFSAGVMFRAGGFRAGITFDDIFSYGRSVYNINGEEPDDYVYYFPFTMNAGLAYDLQIGNFMGIAIAVDWKDITNVFVQKDILQSRRNAWLDLSAGLEVSLFNIIKVRAGMRELLPAVGLGLHFGVFKIDAAYYGREFGTQPGDMPVPMAELSISFSR